MRLEWSYNPPPSPPQGKGLMNTYWVTGKKMSTGETTLNPFQRLKQAASLSPSASPSPSRPTTPPLQCTTSSPATLQPPVPRNMSRAVSPKPDEWPQADRRLSRPEPERARPRSSTLPTIDVNTAQLINGVMETRHGSISGAGCPFSRLEGDISPATPRNRVGSTNASSEFISRHNSLVSEFNLLRIRESVCLPLPPISETNPSQLALFAAFADDNARQARRLADWAAELARTAIRGRGSREGSAEVEPFPTEGTSVDPHQPNQPPEERSRTEPETEAAKQPDGAAPSSTAAAVDTSTVAVTSAAMGTSKSSAAASVNHSSKSNCVVM